jgi:hypothetical protein
MWWLGVNNTYAHTYHSLTQVDLLHLRFTEMQANIESGESKMFDQMQKDTTGSMAADVMSSDDEEEQEEDQDDFDAQEAGSEALEALLPPAPAEAGPAAVGAAKALVGAEVLKTAVAHATAAALAAGATGVKTPTPQLAEESELVLESSSESEAGKDKVGLCSHGLHVAKCTNITSFCLLQ